jgi:hypothetical protein
MSKPLLFVDFDRTLIETDRLIAASWKAIEHLYKVDVTAVLATLEDHYVHVGDLRYYNFDQHIESTLHQPADDVSAAIYPILQKENFVYDDAEEIFNWQNKYEVRILTFGASWYQRFKLGLAPQFKDIPADIMLRPKGEFIAEHCRGRTGWLVDDKYNGGMPPGFTEIHLVRSSSFTKEMKGDIITINSLRSLKELL